VLQDFVSLAETKAARNRLDLRQLVSDDLKSSDDRQRSVRRGCDVAARPDRSSRRRVRVLLCACMGRRRGGRAPEDGCNDGDAPRALLSHQGAPLSSSDRAIANSAVHQRMLKLIGTVISLPASFGGGGGKG